MSEPVHSAAATDSAVLEPIEETVRRQSQRGRPQRQPRYHVILWNDEEHSFDYVIELALRLFGHPPTRGYQIATEVHTRGRAILLTTTKEHAELKRDQVHALGKDHLVAGCRGSMTATIEPEPQ